MNIPKRVLIFARTMCELYHNYNYHPEDIWIGVGDSWDLNLYSDTDAEGKLYFCGALYPVVDGKTITDTFTVIFETIIDHVSEDNFLLE